jgi:hypothetical protein
LRTISTPFGRFAPLKLVGVLRAASAQTADVVGNEFSFLSEPTAAAAGATAGGDVVLRRELNAGFTDGFRTISFLLIDVGLFCSVDDDASPGRVKLTTGALSLTTLFAIRFFKAILLAITDDEIDGLRYTTPLPSNDDDDDGDDDVSVVSVKPCGFFTMFAILTFPLFSL